jgi:hypothetical protein
MPGSSWLVADRPLRLLLLLLLLLLMAFNIGVVLLDTTILDHRLPDADGYRGLILQQSSGTGGRVDAAQRRTSALVL